MQRNAMKYEVQARKQIYTRNNTMTTHHALDATRRMGESMMCGDRRFSTVYYYFFRRLCACMFGLEASLCFVKERIWFCMRHRFSSSHTVLSSTFNRSFFFVLRRNRCTECHRARCNWAYSNANCASRQSQFWRWVWAVTHQFWTELTIHCSHEL